MKPREDEWQDESSGWIVCARRKDYEKKFMKREEEDKERTGGLYRLKYSGIRGHEDRSCYFRFGRQR